MAKIGVKLGFTFRVGPLDTNQYARMDMEIHDLDTEISIEEQLEEAGLTIDKAYQVVHDKVDNGIREIFKKGKKKNGK
jgi:hypothetical protein|tara:strand:- start:102 stop:335 length:234 start_codon:yes stop_codon:yes gene_type:complete